MNEIASGSFYTLQGHVRGYYQFYLVLERWLADVVFREDISRVFLASDNLAFRRRFEITDTSVAYENLQTSSLQFPFANYTINGGWQPDSRSGTNPAARVFLGLSARTRILRSMAVEGTLDVTFYFDREDEARWAYERLLFRSYREYFFKVQQYWFEEQIEIPVFLKVQNLQYAPNFDQAAWLQENRIFTIRATMRARSTVVEPPPQSAFTQGLIPVENTELYPLTQEVISELRNTNNLLNSISITSLFEENPAITVNQFGVVTSTVSNVIVSWDIEASPGTNITQYVLELSNGERVTLDPTVSTYSFNNLTPGSTYIANLTAFSDTGPAKVIPLQFTTQVDPNEEADKNELVGTSW